MSTRLCHVILDLILSFTHCAVPCKHLTKRSTTDCLQNFDPFTNLYLRSFSVEFWSHFWENHFSHAASFQVELFFAHFGWSALWERRQARVLLDLAIGVVNESEASIECSLISWSSCSFGDWWSVALARQQVEIPLSSSDCKKNWRVKVACSRRAQKLHKCVAETDSFEYQQLSEMFCLSANCLKLQLKSRADIGRTSWSDAEWFIQLKVTVE